MAIADLLSLKGRVALITGASRGIGKACAHILAEAGCKLYLTARTDVALAKLAGELKHLYDADCAYQAHDLREATSLEPLYQHLWQNFKRLDFLVNNAGVLQDARLGMISTNQINETLAINIAAPLQHIQLSARLMEKSATAASPAGIINIGSIIGQRGNVGQALYAASKAAIHGMTLAAAKELAAKHIRVNALAPGFIETDMTANLPEAVRQEHLAHIGLGRAGTAAEVAHSVLFLASPLSHYMTGQIIGIDGGMLI